MRNVSPALATFLEARRSARDVQILVADCYTFTLRSGLVLTYTNADHSIALDGFIYAANALLVDGLHYSASIGLEVDQQTITIAARASDTIGGTAFLVALQAGALDGCLVRRARAFLSTWDAAPVGAVTLFEGRVTTVDEIGRTHAEITVASDLVLLDVQMPRMDGPTATQAIRRREAEQGLARTPIIALTANAMVEQVEAYRAAGMDAVVSKPIDLRQLLTAMSEVTGGAGG